jgi:hypothetical protein
MIRPASQIQTTNHTASVSSGSAVKAKSHANIEEKRSMSFQDEHEPARPTRLLYMCQRCNGLHEEPHDDPEVALRRAVEAGDMVRLHRCQDGGTGCCRLIGTGPARHAKAERAA